MRSTMKCLSIGCCLIFASGCNLGGQQHNVSGSQAYQSGQYTQAINQFQQALQANPRDSNAYYNLAASYYSLGKQSKNSQWLQQAEQLYRQSISLNDQHVDAHRGLSALLIETGREKFAFHLLNDWKARYPNSAQPTIELARVYQEYGDNRRATDLLADAIRIDSGNVRALKAMATCEKFKGRRHWHWTTICECFKSSHNRPKSLSESPRFRIGWLKQVHLTSTTAPFPLDTVLRIPICLDKFRTVARSSRGRIWLAGAL